MSVAQLAQGRRHGRGRGGVGAEHQGRASIERAGRSSARAHRRCRAACKQEGARCGMKQGVVRSSDSSMWQKRWGARVGH